MTGAEAIIKCLEKEGVERIFGYPGVAICPFFDAAGSSGIETILVRQEQNAAHEASGYARISGKVGVVAVTSGPGATNLITGIATAFADSIPLVLFSGQVDSRLMGTDGFQEADISGSVESFVKYSYIIRNAEDIPRIVKEAFYIANSGRRGPVLIDLPFDVQKDSIRKFQYPDEVKLRTYKPTIQGHAVQIKKVLAELDEAKKPLMIAGGGIHVAQAVKEVREFVKKRKIPVVSTMMGIGVLPTTDPCYFGMVGNNGSKCAMKAMQEADVILMAGARVADRTIRDPNLISENKILVHIDVDPAEIGKNAGPAIPLVGDVKHIYKEFNRSAGKGDYKEWFRELDECRKEEVPKCEKVRNGTVDPKSFLRELSLAMEEDAVFIADVGQNQLWACANVVVRKGRFLTSGGMGTMGYALPAAIGAKMAKNDKQVVALCGDGGFQMTMMELATANQYGVEVKLVVLNNRTLGLVRQYQHAKYEDRYVVTDLAGGPDLKDLAKAYGMEHLLLTDGKNTEKVLKDFLKKGSSCILECIVDPDVRA